MYCYGTCRSRKSKVHGGNNCGIDPTLWMSFVEQGNKVWLLQYRREDLPHKFNTLAHFTTAELKSKTHKPKGQRRTRCQMPHLIFPNSLIVCCYPICPSEPEELYWVSYIPDFLRLLANNKGYWMVYGGSLLHHVYAACSYTCRDGTSAVDEHNIATYSPCHSANLLFITLPDFTSLPILLSCLDIQVEPPVLQWADNKVIRVKRFILYCSNHV